MKQLLSSAILVSFDVHSLFTRAHTETCTRNTSWIWYWLWYNPWIYYVPIFQQFPNLIYRFADNLAMGNPLVPPMSEIIIWYSDLNAVFRVTQSHYKSIVFSPGILGHLPEQKEKVFCINCHVIVSCSTYPKHLESRRVLFGEIRKIPVCTLSLLPNLLELFGNISPTHFQERRDRRKIIFSALYRVLEYL